jgi:rhodanese-related sulfurtransferase
MCGSSGIDHKTSSTIGFERQHNRGLGFESEAAFIDDAVATIGRQPPNVERIVSLNRGPIVESMGAPSPLTPLELESAIEGGAILIDARTNEQFDEAHIPGALSVSAYDTGFATNVAEVVPPDAELIVVAASDGYELEAAELLASVGIRVRGYLQGGMTAWRSEARPVERIPILEIPELKARMDTGDGLAVLDVRSGREWSEGHIPGSLHVPFQDLPDRLDELPRERELVTICSAGKRSGLAASLLQRAGRSVMHVAHGGVKSWAADGRPLEEG